MAYLREKNKCPGCRDLTAYKPITRIRCKIKRCNKLKSKFCFDCADLRGVNLKNVDLKADGRVGLMQTLFDKK
jgi:hypothetical protein